MFYLIYRQMNERATGRGMKFRDGNGLVGKLNKYADGTVSAQKQESISNTLGMSLRGGVTVWA